MRLRNLPPPTSLKAFSLDSNCILVVYLVEEFLFITSQAPWTSLVTEIYSMVVKLGSSGFFLVAKLYGRPMSFGG